MPHSCVGMRNHHIWVGILYIFYFRFFRVSHARLWCFWLPRDLHTFSFLLSKNRSFFDYVFIFGPTNATKLGEHVVPLQVLARINVGVLLSPEIRSPFFTSSSVAPNPLEKSFLFTHWPPGRMHYWCNSCFGCFTARFCLYSVAKLDAHSAPRCTGSACALRLCFLFFVFIFVSTPR